MNGEVFSMNPDNLSDPDLLEQRLQHALQDLKMLQEERAHLLVALERVSEEQDAMDEELEQKDLLLQEKSQELEHTKTLLAETQQMWMDEREKLTTEIKALSPVDVITDTIRTGPIYQRLQVHHEKSHERWNKMEEHISKASSRLLSLQQRFNQLKKPLDGVLKVMQKAQLQGRKIVEGQSRILNGQYDSDDSES